MFDVCKHFGTCGGCQSQDVPYKEQLQKKEKFIHELFSHLGLAKNILPIIGCPILKGYRNKMEFSFSESVAKARFLGLMKKGQRRVVDLEECLLSPPWFIDVLTTTRKWWEESNLPAYYPPKDRGILRTLTLREGRRSQERMILLTVSGNPDSLLEESDVFSLKEALDPFLEKGTLVVRKQCTEKGKPTFFREEVLIGSGTFSDIIRLENGDEFTFNLRPSSFFQPNPFQAEILYSKALSLASIEETDIVYDLYCGAGTLAIFASRYAKKVIGIEINPEAINDGIENLRINAITNVTLLAGEVTATIKELQSFEKPTLLIVDPPRSGLTPAGCDMVTSLKPKKLLYISCNPITQVQDINQILKAGYHLRQLQPIDQFPHTRHIENIAFLDLF